MLPSETLFKIPLPFIKLNISQQMTKHNTAPPTFGRHNATQSINQASSHHPLITPLPTQAAPTPAASATHFHSCHPPPRLLRPTLPVPAPGIAETGGPLPNPPTLRSRTSRSRGSNLSTSAWCTRTWRCRLSGRGYRCSRSGQNGHTYPGLS